MNNTVIENILNELISQATIEISNKQIARARVSTEPLAIRIGEITNMNSTLPTEMRGKSSIRLSWVRMRLNQLHNS